MLGQHSFIATSFKRQKKGERDEKKVKRSVILYPFWESSYIHFATNHYNFSFWNMLSEIETNEKMQQFCQTQTHTSVRPDN